MKKIKRLKRFASPTEDIEKVQHNRKAIEPSMATDEDIEKFEKDFFKREDHSHNQQINMNLPLDTNVDMTLDFASTNHDVSVLLFTVPSGMTLYTKKLILANTDVTDVASLAYLNSITRFYVVLGVTSYTVTTKTGQALPYYTLTPFSYYNGNIIADFEMQIPQNTPITIYGKYTDAFVTAMIAAGTTAIQYHFNVRLLGQLISVVGG